MAKGNRTDRRTGLLPAADNIAEGAVSEDILDSEDRQSLDSDSVGQAWEVAERSRPDLDDETADGLSPLEEEMRRQAEDVPVGPVSDDELGPPPLPGVGDEEEPVESREIADKFADVPSLTDQEEANEGDGRGGADRR